MLHSIISNMNQAGNLDGGWKPGWKKLNKYQDCLLSLKTITKEFNTA